MNKIRIYLSAPDVAHRELEYLKEAFDSNWIAPLGPNCDRFELELAQSCQRTSCAVLTSGTSAIHLALLLLGIKPGDVVLCQSFTFSGTVNPVTYCGADPVFIDSEKDTWNMDPNLLEVSIQDLQMRGIQPRAIIPVHLYGMPARIREILSISEKYGIPVVEDAAEALGSRYDGRPCGAFGALSILSFNGNKIITTSGGGALLSDNEEWIRKARFLASQARDPAPHYEHTHIGYNYRMSNLLAAMGRAQLMSLGDKVRRRREIYGIYRARLGGIEGVDFLSEPDPGYESNRWLTTILLNPEFHAVHTREFLRMELLNHGIEVRPLWKPMHLQPVFRSFQSYTNGTSESLFDCGLCLPSGSVLADNAIHEVCDRISDFLKR